MSKRKDRERAENGNVYRSGDLTDVPRFHEKQAEHTDALVSHYLQRLPKERIVSVQRRTNKIYITHWATFYTRLLTDKIIEIGR